VTWFCFSAKARTWFFAASLFNLFLLNKCELTSFLHIDHIGLIEEYDSPKKLLKDKSSSLAQLVAEYTRRSNTGFGS
jgi:hypothetical protein